MDISKQTFVANYDATDSSRLEEIQIGSSAELNPIGMNNLFKRQRFRLNKK